MADSASQPDPSGQGAAEEPPAAEAEGGAADGAELEFPGDVLPPEASEEGDDLGQGVRKFTLTAGDPNLGTPVEGATVFAHYRIWVKSSASKVYDTWEERQQIEMTIGSERRDLKGLSVGLRHMRRGERALLHVPPALAYGAEGSFSFPSVPPNADLLYEAQLNGFDNPSEGRSKANLTVEDRIASADKRRLEGNSHFREERPEEALLEYEMALGYMGEEFMMQMFGKYRDMANAVRLPCLLNSAACHLKLGNNAEAVNLCSEVLAEEKDNVKALFRRGKARIAMGRMEQAAEDLQRAQKLAPGDSAVKKALLEIRKDERERLEEQKKLFKGLLSAPKPPVKKLPWWSAVLGWMKQFFSSLFSFFRRKRD